jgi:hypothetical protein
VREGQCQLRDTVPPTPVRPPRHTPQKRTAEPSKEVRTPTPAPALDNAVTSDQWSASPPSPPALCGHLRCCATIAGTAAASPTLWEPGTTRHHHARCCASYGLPSAAPSSQLTDGDQTGNSHTATLEAAPGRVQDSPRRPARARFVRTTINSTTFVTTPSEIILYYRLNHSIWSLSDNKESSC